MTAVASSTGVGTSNPAGAGSPDAAPDLLPAPAAGIAYGGQLCSVFVLLSQQRTVNLTLGSDGVEQTKALQAKALADDLDAVRREVENQSSSGGGFFESIGKAVSDVVDDVLHGNFGEAVSDAGADLASAWNSPHFWSDLEHGLEAISVVGAAVSKAGQTFGGPVGTAVAAVAFEVDQGAELGAHLAGARVESFAAAAQDASADAVASKARLDDLGTRVEALIDGVAHDDQSLARALDSVAAALHTNEDALVASAAVKG